jgi:hypothetical protein
MSRISAAPKIDRCGAAFAIAFRLLAGDETE